MTPRSRIPAALVVLLALAPGAHALAVELEGRAEARVAAGSPLAGAEGLPALPIEASDIVARQAVHGALEPTEAQAGVRASAGASPAAVEGGARVASRAEAWLEPVPEAVAQTTPPALAAAGLLALLQAFGVFRLAGLGGVALYSRLARSELLDNGHRDLVYRLIQETPGRGVTELAAASGLGWGTVVYHLDRLEKAGFVVSERVGLHRCYFPVGTVSREARAHLGALKAETTRSLAAFLVARPGASQTEVCEALGLSASAASKQVSKLESAGLVRRERDWKTVHLYPEPVLPALLAGETSAPAGARPVAVPA